MNKLNLEELHKEIVGCYKCPRLIDYCQRIAEKRKRAYKDWDYWGKPVPGFGDPDAELLIIGLAPAAHGANRTGRVFTGDGSADFLYRALYKAGFANQPTSSYRGDGLKLFRAYVTAVLHCAPPENKPKREELDNCRGYLEKELTLLPKLKAVLALGKTAFEVYLMVLKNKGYIGFRTPYPFFHGALYDFSPPLPTLFASYHPSRQNTQTKRLTEEMFLEVFDGIKKEVFPRA